LLLLSVALCPYQLLPFCLAFRDRDARVTTDASLEQFSTLTLSLATEDDYVVWQADFLPSDLNERVTGLFTEPIEVAEGEDSDSDDSDETDGSEDDMKVDK